MQYDRNDASNTIDLSNLEQLGEIANSPIYLAYPNVYQRHLIPSDVFQLMNERWSTERYPLPPARFYRTKEAYVVAGGMVFTRDGALIAQTAVGYSKEQVGNAKQSVAKAMITRKSQSLCPKAVLCKQPGWENYGHWLIEMLPKAYWARRKLWVNDWSILVGKTSSTMQTIIGQSLEAIGCRAEQIIILGEDPVLVDDLILVDKITAHSTFISPLVYECMDHIVAQAGIGVDEHIYASRYPAISRDFYEEARIRKVFLKYGFNKIETASLPFMDQVRAFKTAKRVTGVMGAAMTNTVFCRPGTEILLFMPASAKEVFFWHIAEGKKLNYHEVRCEEIGPQKGNLPWDRTLKVSKQAIENLFVLLDYQRCSSQSPLGSIQSPSLVTAKNLIGSSWALTLNLESGNSQIIRFQVDGRIDGFTNGSENFWRLSQKYLEILNEFGLCTWRFENVQSHEGRLRLRARYQLNSDVAPVALLEQIGPIVEA